MEIVVRLVSGVVCWERKINFPEGIDVNEASRIVQEIIVAENKKKDYPKENGKKRR